MVTAGPTASAPLYCWTKTVPFTWVAVLLVSATAHLNATVVAPAVTSTRSAANEIPEKLSFAGALAKAGALTVRQPPVSAAASRVRKTPRLRVDIKDSSPFQKRRADRPTTKGDADIAPPSSVATCCHRRRQEPPIYALSIRRRTSRLDDPAPRREGRVIGSRPGSGPSRVRRRVCDRAAWRRCVEGLGFACRDWAVGQVVPGGVRP